MPLTRASCCLAAVAAILGVAVWTPAGQALDSGLMGAGFAPLNSWMELSQLVRRWSLAIAAVLVLVEAVMALRRRRWGEVVRCAALVACAVSIATWLRRVLVRPDLGDPTYPFNTWPSGHAAASAALIVSAFVLLPRGTHGLTARRIAAASMVFVTGASIATMAHRPSDVIAAVLWVAALSALLLPTGPVGWRALQADVRLAMMCAAVGVLGMVTPWVSQFGLVANGAWLACAALVTVGWSGPGGHRHQLRAGIS